jgi:hypothetical protein
MKNAFRSLYLIILLLTPGIRLSDVSAADNYTILSPGSTSYGYVQPGGDFTLQTPGNLTPSGPSANPTPAPSGTAYGYRDGDTTIVITPNQSGSTYVYPQVR